MSSTASWACGPGQGSFDLPWEALQRMRRHARGMAAMSGRRHGWGDGPGPMPPWPRGAWGWGGGPGGQGWGGGPSGGPGRSRAGRGDVRTAILALLAEGPRHGYQLMQDIADRSHGAWKPSPGSVYPALSALQDEGLVDDEKVEGRRVFTLTESGRAHVQERADELGTVFDGFEPEDESELADVRLLIAGVAAAAVQSLTSGTPAQAERARVILAQTRRDLYAVLADENEE